MDIVPFIITNCFLINLASNSKNLKYLFINSSRISNFGILPLNRLEDLDHLSIFPTDVTDVNNITDASIQHFKNMKEIKLPNCSKVTDYSIIKVIKNSPKLETLDVRCTGVTEKCLKKAVEIIEYRKNDFVLDILVSHNVISEDFTDNNPAYNSPRLAVERCGPLYRSN